jgi:hypothetical protein
MWIQSVAGNATGNLTGRIAKSAQHPSLITNVFGGSFNSPQWTQVRMGITASEVESRAARRTPFGILVLSIPEDYCFLFPNYFDGSLVADWIGHSHPSFLLRA